MAFKDEPKSEFEMYKCEHCEDGDCVCHKCGWIYDLSKKIKGEK